MNRAVRIVSHIIILLIIIQALTGILLSLHYVPDSGAAEVRSGVPGTMHYSDVPLIREGDTLAAARVHTLVPAVKGNIVPSGAAASVSLTIERQVSGGAAIRLIHHANASALIVVCLTLFVLLVMTKAWMTNRVLWWTVVIGMVVMLVEAFTGRLLPDDVYSYVSSQIVRHEVSEFPFGSTIAAMLGLNAAPAARLSTPYVIHSNLLPAIITIGVCFLWRQFGRPSTASLIGCAIAVIIGTLTSTAYYPVRDLSNIQAYGSVAPWWPFAVPNLIVTWFGAELAGYLAMALLLGLLTLPLWTRRTP
jgi:quinol-cytochrome oxidoreductase complex cytochrome b subunit